MNRRTDQERLLADVLREETEGDFHAASLGETLRLARRRRHVRLARRVAGVCALLALTTTVALWRRLPAPLPEARLAPQQYELAHTQPLPASCFVSTQPLQAGEIVVSTLASSVIHTVSGLYQELGDDELLALAPQPAALVRLGPGAVELVFVSPPAETGEQRN